VSFEARYHRFLNVRSVGLVSEKLFGPLQVRHVTYLMVAVIAGWRGIASGSEELLALAAATAFFGLASAIAGVKTMSFESKTLAITYSLIDALLSKGSGGGLLRQARVGRHGRPLTTLMVVSPTLLVVVPATARALHLVLYSIDTVLKVLLTVAMIAAVLVPHVLG